MRRFNALPMFLIDFSLIAGLAAGGMMFVMAIVYLGTELIRSPGAF